ncbi:putative metacaspase family protein [Sesbania bispinosa]|nr:putative metacaspase family protein [Sesbania bispinosa]
MKGAIKDEINWGHDNLLHPCNRAGSRGTYGSILKAMRNIIKNAGKEEGGITGEHVAHTITIAAGTTGVFLTAGLDGGILGSVLAILASTSALLVSEIKKILRGMKQKPQLTASENFDVDRKRFIL